jgi:hypothetical protein
VPGLGDAAGDDPISIRIASPQAVPGLAGHGVRPADPAWRSERACSTVAAEYTISLAAAILKGTGAQPIDTCDERAANSSTSPRWCAGRVRRGRRPGVGRGHALAISMRLGSASPAAQAEPAATA